MSPQSIDQAIEQLSSSTKVPVTLLPDPEPEALWCPIISVDDNVLEPLDVFERRLPKKTLERAPHPDFDENGYPYWVIDDLRLPIQNGNGAAGRPVSEWRGQPSKHEEFRPGVWEPKARIADMDVNGVWASLNFCATHWGFAGSRFSLMHDPEVGLAAMRAFNEWMIEDWCGVYPDRLVSCQVPWMRDVDVAAQEVRRNAAAGFVSISFSENPEGQGCPSIHSGYWDPFFKACEETETVINLHVGSSGTALRPSSDSPADAWVALFPVSGIMASVDWIFAKIPVRFPNIKIALSEAGLSWVPMVIERLRRAYRQREASVVWGLSDPDPVELLRRNFFFASIEDPCGFRELDVIGDDHVMIETDYPHMDSSWPRTQSLVRSQLEHLAFDVVKKACFENAARLYRHPLPPDELLARSVVGAH